jgi:hypothetical protein
MKTEFLDRRAAILAEVEAMLDWIQESLKVESALALPFDIRWGMA